MIYQHHPMVWPKDKPVDWVDSNERGIWASELRYHIYDLFSVAFQLSEPPGTYVLSRKRGRESVCANKKVIEEMMALAGSPLELAEKRWTPLPAPQCNVPPELAAGTASPFKELPNAGWTNDERAKWLGYVEGQLYYLVGLLFAAYPEGSDEHLRGRWAVIRLHVFFAKLRVALLMTPMHR
jgi:hypothetical protein